MKIVQLTAENVKKLKAVEITPDGSLVQITGRNGSGKSSVLDSIFYALAGGKDLPKQPIRRGEQSAKVRLDLGELVVTRKFTATGSTLTVEGANGARFPSPQRMLDDLIGAISFDPLEFTRMDQREQFDMLRTLVKLDVDIDAIDGANQRDYDERTDVNRRVKQLRAQVTALVIPTGLPDDQIDVAGLMDELALAGERNGEIEKRRLNRQSAADQVDRDKDAATNLDLQATQLDEEIDRIKKRQTELRAQAQAVRKRSNETAEKLRTAEALPPLVDTNDLRRRVDEANAINAQLERRAQRTKLELEVAAVEDTSAQLTANIAEREKQKAAAIAAAKMPIGGVGFGDGHVLLNELPFEQASSAEQLRVSVAIAMAANPKLRVLRIKEGSLLDEEGLQLLKQMADAGDYQIWIERVDTSGKVGVVMEDGAVVAAPAVADAPLLEASQ